MVFIDKDFFIDLEGVMCVYVSTIRENDLAFIMYKDGRSFDFYNTVDDDGKTRVEKIITELKSIMGLDL